MYIVTGGAGFIGSAMIWKLNSLGIDNILAVDNLASSEKWKNLVNRRFAEYMHRDAFIDMVARDTLEAALGGSITAIIHMGACSSTTERDADFLMRNNLAYSKALCLYALKKKARFINASSAATYGDGSNGFDDDPARLALLKPLNMYGFSKHLFDLWAQKNGILDEVASLKFFNVYGPNEEHKGDMRSVVHKAFQQIRAGGTMRLFRSVTPDYPDGGQMRDFIYVKDCVDVMCWLLEHPMANGVFNVGTGTARSWNDLAGAVFTAMDLPVNIEYIDMPGDLAGKYQNFTEARMERLEAAGYDQPMHSLEQGVADYVRCYLQAPDHYL
ncbi:ADP-glyceromanno-heptose 6-epimerase [Desulfovibrio sp. OttesenSCG-928-G11]|nr:ADP-glyceromanno-heptose 6-epimerase [Desulfovibrio sp. OttesenSCG-928-G11]